MLTRYKQIAILLMCINATPLHGAEGNPKDSKNDPSCACIAQGRRWAQGEVACVGGQNMICSMNQNVASWKKLGTACLVSSHSGAALPFTPM